MGGVRETLAINDREIEFRHAPRAMNQEADRLATIACNITDHTWTINEPSSQKPLLQIHIDKENRMTVNANAIPIHTICDEIDQNISSQIPCSDHIVWNLMEFTLSKEIFLCADILSKVLNNPRGH